MSNEEPPPPSSLIGATLLGKYRVVRVLGKGGMGVVVEARHLALDERVALKFLHAQLATEKEASARFVREAQVAAKIKSEHVARVSDVGTLENGAGYMVMEYLDGRDLRVVIQQQGVLPVPEAVDYVIQASEAISEAHGHGIIHRDIKPANLFLTRRPNGLPLVKVLDFGISKTTGPAVDDLTKTSAVMGSSHYMSPEQMQQARTVDHRADIYSLGICLYELLSGRQPFHAETLPALYFAVLSGVPTPLRSLRGEVPDGLAAVLEKAYARDRGARFQSIGELVVALAPWATPRSQPLIDSIAWMAGLRAPIAGGPGPAPAPAPPGALPTGTMLMGSPPTNASPTHAGARPNPAPASPLNTGTTLLPSPGPPTGAHASTMGEAPKSPPQVSPTGTGATSPPNPAPPTLDAALASAVMGAAPADSAVVNVVPAPPMAYSRGMLVAAAALAVLALGGGVAFFGLRGSTPSTAPAGALAAGTPGHDTPAVAAGTAGTSAVASGESTKPLLPEPAPPPAPPTPSSAEASAPAQAAPPPAAVAPPKPVAAQPSPAEVPRPPSQPPPAKPPAAKPATKSGRPADVAGF